jgi:hypothetical protein
MGSVPLTPEEVAMTSFHYVGLSHMAAIGVLTLVLAIVAG